MKALEQVSEVAHHTIICFEGVDGSGKATQARRLQIRLSKIGRDSTVIRFPDYEAPVGKLIGRALTGDTKFHAKKLRLLYAANRWERADDIKRAIDRGTIVIVDRYSSSNVAYGIADGLEKQWLESLEEGLPKPSVVIMIDTPPEEAIKRKRKIKKLDRYESDLDHMRKVREAYLGLATDKGWIVVDGTVSEEELEEEIWRQLTRRDVL